jgi:hypothetical protein
MASERAQGWWNPFVAERVTLHSPHSPEECAAILKATNYRFWTMANNALPFTGSVRRDRFTLLKNTP